MAEAQNDAYSSASIRKAMKQFQCIETVKQIGRCLIRYADILFYDLGICK